MSNQHENQLILNEELLLAKGGERYCYLHPQDELKVIKISKTTTKSNHQNKLEFIYLQYLVKHNRDLQHLAKCYGYVETNFGEGLVFDRALNFDQSPAHSLQYMMLNKTIAVDVQEQLINELVEYLDKQQILFVDTCLSNVFCIKKNANDYKLIIVDGLGAKRLNYKYWLYIYIGLYRRYKIYKQGLKLKRFHKSDLVKIANGKTSFSRM